MKRFFLFLAGVACLTFVSCNSENIRLKDVQELSNDAEPDEENDSDLKTIAADYCSCVDGAYNDLDPEVKELIMETSRTKDPAKSLAQELKTRSETEYETLMTGIKEMTTNPDGQECMNKMLKKAGIKASDLASLKDIYKIGENMDGCEFMVALLRHSVNSKERKLKRGETLSD